jgi:hypothetical protein
MLHSHSNTQFFKLLGTYLVLFNFMLKRFLATSRSFKQKNYLKFSAAFLRGSHNRRVTKLLQMDMR